MPSLIGQSLGRYHILEQLGKGGMATVYKAFDTRLERNVAVKVILPGQQQSAKFIKRFEREAKVLAQLSNPNIVKVLDYGEQDSMPYIIMEYIPAGTLKAKTGRPIPWQQASHLLVPIARALEYAHQQEVIHRDVKPSNILITQSGEPMLSDFGIANMLSTQETVDLTGTGVGLGTPEYMAPEQGMGKTVDARADIYALGIILYELVTGRRPYEADTPMAIMVKKATEPLPRPTRFVSDLPATVERVLIKALARDPDNRYRTAGEFALALEKLAQGQLDHEVSAPPLEWLNKIKSSRVLWFGLAGVGSVVALLLCTSLLFYIFRNLVSRPTVPTSIPSASVSFPTNAIAPTNPQPTQPTDSMKMISIPAGDFLMGASAKDQQAKQDEFPQHTVSLDAFKIDETEVTVAMFNQCVQTGACNYRNGPTDVPSPDVPDDYYTNPTYANYPAVDVPWKQADNYCLWAGKRLPTEAEWEKAARGTDGRMYPWGNQPPSGNLVNFCDANCSETYANGAINDGYADRAPVGSFLAGASPFGLLDMAGNVWEWVQDWYDGNYYANSSSKNPQGPSNGSQRVVRGGGWDSIVANLRVTKRLYHPPDFFSGSLGFRCAADATP